MILFQPIFPPPGQTNSLVDIKTHREALSQATEAVSILTIHKANVTDTGIYCCNVTSIGTKHSQQTQVTVYGKTQSRVLGPRGTSSPLTFACLFGQRESGAATGCAGRDPIPHHCVGVQAGSVRESVNRKYICTWPGQVDPRLRSYARGGAPLV